MCSSDLSAAHRASPLAFALLLPLSLFLRLPLFSSRYHSFLASRSSPLASALSHTMQDQEDTRTATGQEGLISQDGPEPALDAGRTLAATLATTLPADQMEVLLNLIIKRGGENHPSQAPGQATTAPAGNPAPLSPATASLQIRFPTVDPAHFKEIPGNKRTFDKAFAGTDRREPPGSGNPQ